MPSQPRIPEAWSKKFFFLSKWKKEASFVVWGMV
jgi:hypothetical protein